MTSSLTAAGGREGQETAWWDAASDADPGRRASSLLPVRAALLSGQPPSSILTLLDSAPSSQDPSEVAAEALLLRGIASARGGQMQDGAKLCAALAERCPDQAEWAALGLEWAMCIWAEAGEIAAARRALDRLDREYPQSRRAGALAAADRVYLRWLLADQRRPAEELQAWGTGVRADLGRLAESLADEVGRSYAHFLCAHLWEEQGDLEEALRHYQQVTHRSFRFMGRPESLVQQAHCLESLGRSPEVIAVTQEFLASFADHAWRAPARHLLYQARHYYEPLRAWAEGAEKTGPTPEEGVRAVRWHLARGDFSGAWSRCERLLAGPLPADLREDLLYQRALLALVQNRPEEALPPLRTLRVEGKGAAADLAGQILEGLRCHTAPPPWFTAPGPGTAPATTQVSVLVQALDRSLSRARPAWPMAAVQTLGATVYERLLDLLEKPLSAEEAKSLQEALESYPGLFLPPTVDDLRLELECERVAWGITEWFQRRDAESTPPPEPLWKNLLEWLEARLCEAGKDPAQEDAAAGWRWLRSYLEQRAAHPFTPELKRPLTEEEIQALQEEIVQQDLPLAQGDLLNVFQRIAARIGRWMTPSPPESLREATAAWRAERTAAEAQPPESGRPVWLDIFGWPLQRHEEQLYLLRSLVRQIAP